MLRPSAWVVGTLAFALVPIVVLRPPARTTEASDVLTGLPISPSASPSITACTSVESREALEESDCLQTTRLRLLAGQINLAQALAMLEACAGERLDLVDFARRSLDLRDDGFRARVAFGEALAREDVTAAVDLVASLDRNDAAPSTGSVARLRAAGVTPAGLTDGREAEIVERLGADEALRADFRAVFGDRLADDLDALFSPNAESTPAVALGRTTLVPNRSPMIPTSDGTLTVEDLPVGGPIAVDTDLYSMRLLSDLEGLEFARMRYLASAGQLNQRTGSIRFFLASVKSPGDEAAVRELLRREVARDRGVVAARLANLDRRLGVDPLIGRMAGESIGLATEIGRECEIVAMNRGRTFRTGAGVVIGLVGAAGVVVATGATGTLLGGVTIAAAIEATVGAYFIARTERIGAALASSARPNSPTLDDPEERRFQRPAGQADRDSGAAGDGGGEPESWFDDFGEARELAFLGGDGIELQADGEDAENTSPRENHVPPVLPIDIPEALRELPPLLDNLELRALRELTLPEIQERLDEFLAGSDPAAWTRLIEDESAEMWSLEEMLEEAREALRIWETRRELVDGFGPFFVRAELERLPERNRAAALSTSVGRYLHDREYYRGSPDIPELRRRVATRLVAHCRAGPSTGDLVLAACTDETALSLLLLATLRDLELQPPDGRVVGVQVFEGRFEAVLYWREQNSVYSLTRGSEQEGVVAPIYHPATFFYGYLVDHAVTPEIDIETHLLIALPDRPMPPELESEECVDSGPSAVGRAVEWVGAMFGVRRVSDGSDCGAAEVQRQQQASRGGARNADLAMPTPRNPLQRGGGGQSGGGQGGGGSGGGSPLAANAPADPLSDGSSGSATDSGGQGGSGQNDSGSSSGSSTGQGDSAGTGGTEQANASSQGRADGAADSDGQGGSGGGSAEDEGAGNGDGGASDGEDSGAGSGGTGGYGLANRSLPAGPSLAAIGRETVRTAARFERAADLRVVPWRLREDEAMMSGSTSGVLYADNARALERFGVDDLFITLTPAEVEAQRRMLEADAFPIFQAEADCGSPNLPPRRVFRRVAAGESGFRYVFCDHDESMVIFRDRSDADSYATLSAPDRPLYLARLASERLARFERSAEIRRLNAFLDDPNVLADYSREEIYSTVKAAADLLVFQNALESALVQSMNELGPSGIRGYYYDMHRQVLQAPLFLAIAEKVFRLNQRLVSDPLQSLAWANVQEPLARQGFFDLYFTVGRIMEWPERWVTLQQRYGNEDAVPQSPAAASDVSLDFLQILSDPGRVRVDWMDRETGSPSIRDRAMQEGIEHTTEVRPDPTLAEQLDRQDEVENLRGGTNGLGRAGTGDSIGPEEGRRPLQMILIRITPDSGDPDREQLPDDNQVRPGGTEGLQRRQTEESASRQEPVLWVSPQTFLEAVLSTWDSRDLEPTTAGRVPPLLRFNEELREVFLDEFLPVAGVYDNRLRAAMETFTRSGWLQFEEVRDAMGGSMTTVRARDVGRFSGAYSGNAPINDQDQIRIPNFFSSSGVIIPADLFQPVRDHYTRSVLGIFDLSAEGRVAPALSLSDFPVEPGDAAQAARENLLRSLELIREQADEAN